MSGAPYGYRYTRKTDEMPAAYTVYEPEARVVQRIYEMYTVQGFSIGEITRRLNAEGISTRKGSARGERDDPGVRREVRAVRVSVGYGVQQATRHLGKQSGLSDVPGRPRQGRSDRLPRATGMPRRYLP